MTSLPIRTRFAPSPTGTLHLGGLRTALYNLAFAKQQHGKFIIRVEDTDEARSSREFEKVQLEALRWAGVVPDESPYQPGAFGPYRQSERLEIYQTYAKQLIQKGHAFYCFCKEAELDQKAELAKAQNLPPQYDGTCRKLTKENVQKRLADGEQATVRFKAFIENITLKDLIRGEVEFKAGMVGDFVILRANGMPVYNFAVVVDDALMEITHVIRAEEHLPNTYRQMMIYTALGFKQPQFAHLSFVMGRDEDGNVSKLSKRHGATSTDMYKAEGYLPEAVCNYIALLGWSSPDNLEKFSRQHMVEKFSFERVSKSPSTFDPEKLKWLNGLYLRELPSNQFYDLALPFLKQAQRVGTGTIGEHLSEEQIQALVKAVQNNCVLLKDVVTESEIFFDLPVTFDEEARAVLQWPQSRAVVEALQKEISNLSQSGQKLQPENFKTIKKAIQTSTAVKGKELFLPIRVALTGKAHGPDLDVVITCLAEHLPTKRIAFTLEQYS